ncbi:MAG: YtxH domain-containing protein [Cyclobacteriaceae bacterium]|nr:YtxH domain-containing protein [Cyclobacteriaceae bacterium]
MKNVKLIVGVAAGIAAGALLGVLFAPEKGVDTRKKISKKGKDLADELNHTMEEKFNELMREVSTRFGRVKNDLIVRKPEHIEN